MDQQEVGFRHLNVTPPPDVYNRPSNVTVAADVGLRLSGVTVALRTWGPGTKSKSQRRQR